MGGRERETKRKRNQEKARQREKRCTKEGGETKKRGRRMRKGSRKKEGGREERVGGNVNSSQRYGGPSGFYTACAACPAFIILMKQLHTPRSDISESSLELKTRRDHIFARSIVPFHPLVCSVYGRFADALTKQSMHILTSVPVLRVKASSVKR